VEFRVWAPRAREVGVRLRRRTFDLADAGDGVYDAVVPAGAGDDYWFVVDGKRFPDPCSRWQPEGIRGPSRVLSLPAPAPAPAPAARAPAPVPAAPPRAPAAPADPERLVIYELHVGTFTPEGTFEAAIPYLRQLAELGITAIELMPVAEFPGSRGWGYDGIYISAAQSSYGGPHGLAKLVAAAHEQGLAVILDVVYNHIGTSGIKAFDAFGPYFTDRHETPWGRAINYDQDESGAVREWVLQSATGWIRDFGIDGLRLDAIHSIYDSSPEHVVAALVGRVHEERSDALVIGELGLADPREHGAPSCDALWVDRFHHALRAALTGEREGYYADFGRVEQLADAYLERPPKRIVVYSQNHDQVGNRAFGDRLPAELQPLAALCTLLSPFVPLLFMGEEYGERAPFQFFSDHIDKRIADATRKGRRREFAAFAQFSEEEIPDPQDPATFERSKLSRERDPEIARLYEQLLAVRRELPFGPVDGVSADEQLRMLRVRRGRFELVCNFGSEALSVDVGNGALRLATSPGTRLEPARLDADHPSLLLRVAPLSGALMERSQ
jgi:maltooligosyltrehalose trehalohydrolase